MLANKSKSNCSDEFEPLNDDQSEAEEQVKLMLDKQLNTKISVQDICRHQKEFASGTTQNDPVSEIKGQTSLNDLKHLKRTKELEIRLQQLGLTELEIQLYFEKEGLKPVQKRMHMNPDVLQKLQDDLLEKTKNLTTENTNMKLLLDENPMNHLNDMIENICKRKKIAKAAPEKPTHDPFIHNAIIPIPLEDIQEKRLSIAQIQQLPRFKDYNPGSCKSKKLFVKNLHPKVQLAELMALFNNFQNICVENEKYLAITYRLLTGRMKGQAFVSFPSLEQAENALNTVNGFPLHGKPIIIQYTKQ